MTKEEVLKSYICTKYKSVRQFTIEKGLKYSTLASILSRGIDNSSIVTVFEVCRSLDISVDYLVEKGIILENKRFEEKDNRLYRRLESYATYFQIMGAADTYLLDDKKLDDEEVDLLTFGMNAIIEMLRQRRANLEKKKGKE